MKKGAKKVSAKGKDSKVEKLILALHKDLKEDISDVRSDMNHRFTRVDASILDLQTDASQIKEDVISIKRRVGRLEVREEVFEDRLKKVEAKV